MRNRITTETVLEVINTFSPMRKRKIMELLLCMKSELPQNTVGGASLIKYSGILTGKSASAMTSAIEESCGKVNPDEW